MEHRGEIRGNMVNPGVDENYWLNNLSIYKDKKCVYCGRGYPDTKLNIEGVIHHNCEYRCLDVESCNKHKKKRG